MKPNTFRIILIINEKRIKYLFNFAANTIHEYPNPFKPG